VGVASYRATSSQTRRRTSSHTLIKSGPLAVGALDVASQRSDGWLTGYPAGVRAYSMDLRERVVAAVDAGMSQPQAAAVFGVSLRTVERYLAGGGRPAA
jgi:Homeodomain-like domain